MMNFSLFNIILNNRLSNNLISRNLNSFCSSGCIKFRLFSNRFHLYSSIRLSFESNINIFSLNNRLNICLVINFFTWSSYSLCSSSFLKNWFSHNRLFNFILWFSFLEFNSFNIINNLSLDNRLSINFFSRSSYNFSYNLFIILYRSSLYRSIIDLGLTSIDLKLYIFSQYSWLNILFSNSSLSWYINRYSFSFDFTINDRFLIFSFGIDRSWYNLFSNDRCLYYSLFNDWLLNYSLSNNRLRNNFSSYNWFRYNLLSLSNNWFRIKYFSTNKLSTSSILSTFGLHKLCLTF